MGSHLLVLRTSGAPDPMKIWRHWPDSPKAPANGIILRFPCSQLLCYCSLNWRQPRVWHSSHRWLVCERGWFCDGPCSCLRSEQHGVRCCGWRCPCVPSHSMDFLGAMPTWRFTLHILCMSECVPCENSPPPPLLVLSLFLCSLFISYENAQKKATLMWEGISIIDSLVTFVPCFHIRYRACRICHIAGSLLHCIYQDDTRSAYHLWERALETNERVGFAVPCGPWS